MALALMVSTRLWLGGAGRRPRDAALIGRLIGMVRAVAGPIWFCTDG